MSDQSKSRQDLLDDCIKNKYFLESKFDFSDCDDADDISDAICKMMIDNFDVGHKGTYIQELVLIACRESAALAEASIERSSMYNSDIV